MCISLTAHEIEDKQLIYDTVWIKQYNVKSITDSYS